MKEFTTRFGLGSVLSEKGIILIIAFLFVIVAIVAPQNIELFESKVIKSAVAIRGALSKPKDILLIEIDSSSLEEKGKWPWSERKVSSLFNELSDLKFGIVALESEIVADSKFSGRYISTRELETTPLVLGYNFYPTLADIPSDEENLKPRFSKRDQKDLDSIALPSNPLNDSMILGMVDIEQNELSNTLAGRVAEGYTNIFRNKSGLAIKEPLAVRYMGRIFPSYPLQIYSKWRGFTAVITENPKGKPTGINIGEEHIPTAPNIGTYINFRGPGGSFKEISASDILDKKISPVETRGKIALVGLKSSPSHDTPLGKISGLEMHANILDNMLRNRFLTSWIGWKSTVPAFLCLAILIALIIGRLSQFKKFVVGASLIASTWILGWILIWSYEIWFPAVEISLFIFAAFISSILWRVFARDIPKHNLSRNFGWRLAKSSIERLVIDAKPIRPEGHLCEITAMAIDIKGFGSLSDRLSPDMLVKFVREYRILVSDTLIRYGAMIESWSGDDVRAVFSAPLKMKEHSLYACLAALDLKRTISTRVSAWHESYAIERLRIGIGIHTGKATAGDFGLGYGVMGGAVEAAVQLRRLNRAYRTWALVGKPVHTATNGAVEYRELDPVLLWGEVTPTTIYELIGESGTIHPTSKYFGDALEAYLSGDFKNAAKLFEEILATYPHDGPSRLFARRALALHKSPPNNWRGVWR